MKRLIFILLVITVLYAGTFAQNDSPCPKLEVIAHPIINKEYEPLIFSLSSNKSVKNSELKYEWNTSTGKIIEGQGTSSIYVSAVNLGGGTPITVTVKINGLPAGCLSEFSGTNFVAVQMIGERDFLKLYGKVSIMEELSGLDQIFAVLDSSEKDYRGLIWIRIDKTESISATKKHVQKLLQFAERRGREYDWGKLIFSIEKSDRHSMSGIILSPKEIWKCENCENIKGSDIKLKKSR